MKKQSFFITATNTDVGKTFVTCAFLEALKNKNSIAIKPVQTGCIEKNGKLISPDVEEYEKIKPSANPKYALSFPSSLHYAAKKENKYIDIEKIYNYSQKYIKKYDYTLIEGAGGIFVPINENKTMLDLMKMLNLSIILVCKNELGAINQTLLSIETLQNHGLKIAFLVVNFHDKKDEIHISNLKYFKSNFNFPIITLPKFKEISYQKVAKKFKNIIVDNDEKIDLEFDKKHLWHPYTSAKKPLKSYFATHTQGNYIYIKNKKLLDGMSSWWCAFYGYNNKFLQKALIEQVNKMPHIMFGGITHENAINLGKKLLNIVPKNLQHIFYCDSGSVSVEVAIKLALQYQQNKNPQKNTILTIKGGYYGDTFGAMSVSDPENGMHFLFNNILAKQIFAPKPSCAFDDEFDDSFLDIYKKIIKQNKEKIAAILVEPIVQGAGGMWFYHKEYLKFFRKICTELDILLIFDEIATGFGRTGEMFASFKADVNPDILCIGKALTGGFMSFAATLTTKKVAFGVCENDHVFMHGPTFMANPLTCKVALANLEFLEKTNYKHDVAKIQSFLKQNLAKCKVFKEVVDVRILGAIGVVEMNLHVNVQKLQNFFVKNNVWIRPFGKNIYLMPPFSLNENELSQLVDAIYQAILKKQY